MILTAAAVGLGASVVAAHGAFYRNSQVFGSVLTELPFSGQNVSLTFDDGPNEYATPRILDSLAAHGVKATFFLLGAHAKRWPQIAKRIAVEGHQLGNHGYHHRKLHFKSPSYVRMDITMGKQAIENACGISPRLFRAPHGFRSPWVTRIASSLGHRTVGWSLGVWDTDRPGVQQIIDRTVSGAKARSILLLHDGDGYDPEGDRAQTADAIPGIIAGLRQRGFSFSTIPTQ